MIIKYCSQKTSHYLNISLMRRRVKTEKKEWQFNAHSCKHTFELIIP